MSQIPEKLKNNWLNKIAFLTSHNFYYNLFIFTIFAFFPVFMISIFLPIFIAAILIVLYITIAMWVYYKFSSDKYLSFLRSANKNLVYNNAQKALKNLIYAYTLRTSRPLKSLIKDITTAFKFHDLCKFYQVSSILDYNNRISEKEKETLQKLKKLLELKMKLQTNAQNLQDKINQLDIEFIDASSDQLENYKAVVQSYKKALEQAQRKIADLELLEQKLFDLYNSLSENKLDFSIYIQKNDSGATVSESKEDSITLLYKNLKNEM